MKRDPEPECERKSSFELRGSPEAERALREAFAQAPTCPRCGERPVAAELGVTGFECPQHHLWRKDP